HAMPEVSRPGAQGVVSFNLLDDIGDAVTVVVHGVESAAGTVLHTVESVGKAVAGAVTSAVPSLEVGLSTVINGINGAGSWVLKPVDDIARAVGSVLQQIGCAITKVIDFLASLFDWGDFLEAADAIQGMMKAALDGAGATTAKVVTWARTELRALES